MRACGLIVEYNPFHFGHLHHVQEAKRATNADCMIAVMSGSFLERGEPAIIDKFHRTRAAIESGVDIIIELPYAYAVQSSTFFAEGAVQLLAQMGVDSICFGSESGNINDFLQAYISMEKHQDQYEKVLHIHLDKGMSFPAASQKAYQAIGLEVINLVQPNNILGLSYVRAIRKLSPQIEPVTIKRIKNNYHEKEIHQPIASATSIREEILSHGFTQKMKNTMPKPSLLQLKAYKQLAGTVHDWESYFPFLKYKVMSTEPKKLQEIHGIDEGLEYRFKRTAKEAESFSHWLHLMKTKRYTQTRLQRCFVHLLTNTSKKAIRTFTEHDQFQYVRILGFSPTGRQYVNQQKKQMDMPIFTSLNKNNATALELDEKAQQLYYAPLPIQQQKLLRKQEFQLPIMIQ